MFTVGLKNLFHTARVDIIRDPDSGLINCQVELPGLKFEEIRLTVHGGRLVIDGTRHLPIKNAGKSKSTFLVHEVEYGRIHRKIALPPDIQVSSFPIVFTLDAGSSLFMFQGPRDIRDSSRRNVRDDLALRLCSHQAAAAHPNY